MSFYLGIDLGTSGVKVVVVDEQQTIVEQESAPLSVDSGASPAHDLAKTHRQGESDCA